MKMSKQVVVKQPEKPIPTEVLADSIKAIAEGMRKMNASSLSRRGLLVLLKDYSGVSMNEIDRVLDCLSQLDKRYCK